MTHLYFLGHNIIFVYYDIDYITKVEFVYNTA